MVQNRTGRPAATSTHPTRLVAASPFEAAAFVKVKSDKPDIVFDGRDTSTPPEEKTPNRGLALPR